MESITDIQALLLAAQHTAESNLNGLQALAAERRDIFNDTLLYRLLITYLPSDSAIDSLLLAFLRALQSGFANVSALDSPLDLSSVESLSGSKAQEKLKSLRLEHLEKTYDEEGSDLLTDFLVEWINRLETLGGIAASTVDLVDAFTSDHPSLLHWRNTYFEPLYHLKTELYPGRAEFLRLRDFEALSGISGVSTLLQFSEADADLAPTHISRDLTDVVAPWVAGASQSKRRRVNTTEGNASETLTSWSDINEWILTTSTSKYKLAAQAVLGWDGPKQGGRYSEGGPDTEVDDVAFSQTAMAVAYTHAQGGAGPVELRQQLLRRSATLVGLMPPNLESVTPDVTEPTSLASASRADLLENNLLQASNSLTRPSTDAIEFLNGVLATQHLLATYKLSVPTLSIASAALFDSEEKHKHELQRILQQILKTKVSDVQWRDVRHQILWLRSWQNDTQSGDHGTRRIAYLGRLSPEVVENSLLDSMLSGSNYSPVEAIYLADNSPLSPTQVESRVVAAIYTAYDNASNGNRARGGMKRASDILKAFQPHFKTSSAVSKIDHLLKATHSLSFYQLTLQYGVPFQPVSIRVHRDPLALVEKVLDQNPKAYTKLDDLLEIGRHLARADLPTSDFTNVAASSSTSTVEQAESLEQRIFDAEHRVTHLAIISALLSNDFDTAYSYITSRLSTSIESAKTPASLESAGQFTDDTSWRAAYAAGRYRPPSASATLHERISSLSKRMDLLSIALVIAPSAEPLPEILATWRRCEEEMDSLRSQALEEERSFESLTSPGLDVVPGGFGPDDRDLDAEETRRRMQARSGGFNSTGFANNGTGAPGGGVGPSYEEEAPMGLFDVARGAASAFRKSTFPLGSAGGRDLKIGNTVGRSGNGRVQTRTGAGPGLDDESSFSERPTSAGTTASTDEQQRVRKRDVISNAVTGGFVSGMSWVLGAQPVQPRSQEEQHR